MSKRQRLTITTDPERFFIVTRLSAVEELSRLTRLELDLVSEARLTDISSVVGRRVSIAINAPTGKSRRFIGILKRLVEAGRQGDGHRDRAEVISTLWLTARTPKCRMFQNRTVPDIVAMVLREYEGLEFLFELKGTWPVHDYCVQYKETDLNFIGRLIEDSGVCYYFDSTGSCDIVVFRSAADPAPETHVPIPIEPGQILSWELALEGLRE
jgi:type VI secretion system secreted protein VgrG